MYFILDFHLLGRPFCKKKKITNWNISTEWAKILSFVLEKVLCYRGVTYFLINNLFGNTFQASRVIDLLTPLYMKLLWEKVFKLLEKVFPSLAVYKKTIFQKFRVVFIIFKLIN